MRLGVGVDGWIVVPWRRLGGLFAVFAICIAGFLLVVATSPVASPLAAYQGAAATAMTLCLVLAVWQASRRVAAHMSDQVRYCPYCGYDMCSLTSSQCPECGGALAQHLQTKSRCPTHARRTGHFTYPIAVGSSVLIVLVALTLLPLSPYSAVRINIRTAGATVLIVLMWLTLARSYRRWNRARSAGLKFCPYCRCDLTRLPAQRCVECDKDLEPHFALLET